MVLFLFTLLLMFSLSAALYLMVRALPRVEDGAIIGARVDSHAKADGFADGAAIGRRRGLLDRWAHSEIPEKIDASFNSWLLKFLRKFKVVVLKLDNSISNHLQKINREEKVNVKKAAIDFKDIVAARDED